MKLEWFVIAPSARIAGLCHSIVRGEPYTTCSIACSYCYAQWYRGPHGRPKPIRRILHLIRELGRVRRERGIAIPVRIAALSDPFQPAELQWRLTRKALKEALKRGVPVILNTRLKPPGQDYWGLMREAASRGLLLLQVTITGPPRSGGALRLFEPGSPANEERLEVAGRASEQGIPVAVRLQPLIPGIGDSDPEGLASSIASAGAKLLTVEFLRAEKPFLEKLAAKLADVEVYRTGWESYAPGAETGEERLLHPPLEYRLRVAEEYSRLARRQGIAFQTCKEGLYHVHHPSWMDCCGFALLEPKPPRRPHLADLYRLTLEKGVLKVESVSELCGNPYANATLCGKLAASLPRWLSRPLRLHERRLERILRKPNYTVKLAPVLGHRADGYYPRLKPLYE